MRRGFGITEMLIVILILAVLLALLLPAISSARRSAHVTACASNLRQIGQALLTYRSEHRQWPVLKPFYFDLSNHGMAPASMSEDEKRVAGAPYLQPALRDFIPPYSQVYHCPGDTDGGAYDHRRELTGFGSSYTEGLVLYGFRAQRGRVWEYLEHDFVAVSWGKDGLLTNPRLHPRSGRFNVNTLKTDGSVETAMVNEP